MLTYAQNFEDVRLWRALKQVGRGTYVDVGAADPDRDSVTKWFYDSGWSGIDVEPVEESHRRLEAARPRDVVVAAVCGPRSGAVVLHEIPGTGLSTLDAAVAEEAVARGYDKVDRTVTMTRLDDLLAQHITGEIHFLKIDVEGAEAQVLEGLDLARWRPWVIVIEATAPNTLRQVSDAWHHTVTSAGYVEAGFDGLNLYFVAAERTDLAEALDAPVTVLDGFALGDTHWMIATAPVVEEAREEAARSAELLQQVEAWAQQAESWARASESTADDWKQRWLRGQDELERLNAIIADFQDSLSWRATAPLRRAKVAADRTAATTKPVVDAGLNRGLGVLRRHPRVKRPVLALLYRLPLIGPRLLGFATDNPAGDEPQ